MRMDEARVGVHSEWPFDDPRAWSGMIRPAVAQLDEVLDMTRLAPARTADALIDRARARLSPRTVLPAHSIATSLRRSLSLQLEVRRSAVDAVVALASSSDLVRPLAVPVIQITDATFPALQGFYPMYSDLAWSGRMQGNWVERHGAKNTHHFVVTSDWAKDSLVHDTGFPEERITIAPFGPAIAPPPGVLPRTVEEDRLRLVLVASDWERKNGTAALEIVERLRESRDVELLIVGAAPPEAARSATLLGRLNAADLSNVYSRGHILLEPALANASGVVITDALHHGLPVLASAVGGVPTLVDTSTGWLLPPENLVASAVEILSSISVAELESRSRAAADWAARSLSWDGWAEAIARIEI